MTNNKTKAIDKYISIAGLSRITNHHNHPIRRIVWFLLVVSGTAFLLYHLIERMQYYLRRPTTTKFDINYASALPLPGFTVCYPNSVEEFTWNIGQGLQRISYYFGEENLCLYQQSYGNVKKNCTTVPMSLPKNLKFFKGRQCDRYNVGKKNQMTAREKGIFNSIQFAIKVTRTVLGLRGPYKIQTEAQEDYQKGINFWLHEPNESADAALQASQHISLRLGQQTYITLKYQRETFLKNCYRNNHGIYKRRGIYKSDRYYNRDECYVDCVASFLQSKKYCGCYPEGINGLYRVNLEDIENICEYEKSESSRHEHNIDPKTDYLTTTDEDISNETSFEPKEQQRRLQSQITSPLRPDPLYLGNNHDSMNSNVSSDEKTSDNSSRCSTETKVAEYLEALTNESNTTIESECTKLCQKACERNFYSTFINTNIRFKEEHWISSIENGESPLDFLSTYVIIYFDTMAIHSTTEQWTYNFLSLLCDIGGAFGILLGSCLFAIFELIDWFLCILLSKAHNFQVDGSHVKEEVNAISQFKIDMENG